MKRHNCLAAVVCGLAAVSANAGEPTDAAAESPAVVTINTLGPVVRGQSGESYEGVFDDAVSPAGHHSGCTDGACGSSACTDGSCQSCNECQSGSCHQGRTHRISGWLKGQSDIRRDRNLRASSKLAGFMRSKFGYFVPTGNNGRGVPLYGKYSMVYAQNPKHTDSRDGYSFAAPGYGTPVNVPLAPNVRHTMNYGWGIPSSRLTPLRQATVVGPPVDVVHGPRW